MMRRLVSDIGYVIGKWVIGIGNRCLYYLSTAEERADTDCGIVDEEAWTPWPPKENGDDAETLADLIYDISPMDTPMLYESRFAAKKK